MKEDKKRKERETEYWGVEMGFSLGRKEEKRKSECVQPTKQKKSHHITAVQCSAVL